MCDIEELIWCGECGSGIKGLCDCELVEFGFELVENVDISRIMVSPDTYQEICGELCEKKLEVINLDEIEGLDDLPCE
jgi:hypothetical protein